MFDMKQCLLPASTNSVSNPLLANDWKKKRKVKQGGMGNGTTAKEGLGDLNAMKSTKKYRKNCPGHSLIVIH